MLSSDSLQYVIIWVHGSVFYPLGLYVILLLSMLSSGSVCYPLAVYVILWVRMLSSGSVCYPLGSYSKLLIMFLVAILCYLLMLSFEIVTNPVFYYSWKLQSFLQYSKNIQIFNKICFLLVVSWFLCLNWIFVRQYFWWKPQHEWVELIIMKHSNQNICTDLSYYNLTCPNTEYSVRIFHQFKFYCSLVGVLYLKN
jgi:hypothetical protein